MDVSWLYRLVLSVGYLVMCVACSNIELDTDKEIADFLDKALGKILENFVDSSRNDRLEASYGKMSRNSQLPVDRQPTQVPDKIRGRLSGLELERPRDNNETSSEAVMREQLFSQFGLTEGRKVKAKKYMMTKMLIGLKIFTIGLVLPAIIGLALFASWKGMTISLMALLMASIIGMRNLISAATKHEGHPHILITSLPSHQHQHWWRRTEGPELTGWDDSHDLVYRGH